MYVFKLPSQMCVGVAEKQNLISAIYMTNDIEKITLPLPVCCDRL